MKRSYYKWFIPVIVFVVMISTAFLSYRSSVRKHAFEHAVSVTCENIESGLRKSDLNLQTILDANYGTAMTFEFLNLNENSDFLVSLIANLKETVKVTEVMAVDNNGAGYNDRGKRVDISGENYFEEITSRFKNGGSGFVLLQNDAYEKGSVAAVSSVSFADQSKGYLITIVYNEDLSENLFGSLPPDFLGYYISLDGYVIIRNGDDRTQYFAEEIWPHIPKNINSDSIKLCVVQKKKLVTDVENYGCLMLIPSGVTTGAVLILAPESALEAAIRGQMNEFYTFCLWILASFAVYTVLCVLVLFFTKLARKSRMKQFDEKNRRDKLTGLYTESGGGYEIDRYIKEEGNRAGILFVIRVENFTRLRNEKGDAEANRQIVSFAENFAVNFRVSDVVGRCGDDEFFAFLKDIRLEKDVRKQVDEMQLFLHDIREERKKTDDNLTAYTGVARCPSNGANSRELFEYARLMLASARDEISSRSSFTK